MHYYKRNLGDYAKKAGRLSMLQHGAYTLLIDACYDREQFPTLEDAIEWTWASSSMEIEAVEFVLRKFFTLENGIYIQKRIQEEIVEYHQKAEINKKIAIEREAKRKEKSTNRTQGDNEVSPNQEPRTKNQEPRTTINTLVPSSPCKYKNLYPEWFEEIWVNYPERSGSNDKRKAFHAANARFNEGKTPKYMADAVDRYKNFLISTSKINTEFVQQAATFFGPGGHIDNPWSISDAAYKQSGFYSSSARKTCAADLVRSQAKQLFDQNGSAGGVIICSTS